MLEEFCEGNHCDQYIPSAGRSFAQCLMVQRELSRVGACPLRYESVVAKAVLDVRAGSRGGVKSEPVRKKGFHDRAR